MRDQPTPVPPTVRIIPRFLLVFPRTTMTGGRNRKLLARFSSLPAVGIFRLHAELLLVCIDRNVENGRIAPGSVGYGRDRLPGAAGRLPLASSSSPYKDVEHNFSCRALPFTVQRNATQRRVTSVTCGSDYSPARVSRAH